MRNNQSQSRTGAGASGRRTPSRAGAGRSAGAERSGRRDSKPFDGERREARPVGRPRKDSKPFAGEQKDEKQFRRPRREIKPFGGENIEGERTFRGPRREGVNEGSYSRTPREGGSERSFSRPRRDSFGSDGPKRIVKSRSTKPKAKSDDGMVRLNKFISNSGVCSRREADEYIVAGLVSVNGEVITELGTKIKQDSDVRFNGERLKGEEKVYILMNKPKDFVTTVSDPNADKTVMDLIAGKCSQRVYPVGRLDKQTTGVLLLTNDGEMADNLTHPSNMHKKIYHIVLDKNLSGSDFNAILEGITLDDGPVHADSLAYVDGEKSEVGLEIHSGRNRVVRRIFEHLGYKVKRLDRVFFAGLTKKNLRRGQWRFLTELEISMLKMGAYE